MIGQRTRRVIVAILAIALLLSPGVVMALVYTELNLLVSVLAVALVLAFSRVTAVRWVMAVMGAVLVAVPPYPFWVFSDNEGHWFFSFFGGFTLGSAPIGTFAIWFALALASFAALFWAIGRRQDAAIA